MTEVIVIDPGSSTWKVGFSGEDLPQAEYPSIINASLLPESQDRTYYRGGEVEDGSGYGVAPIVRGNTVDFDAFEKLLEKAFEELRLKPEEAGMPILITESPLTSKENREKVAQLVFERFKAPGLCIANSAVMSLFCSGRTRGVTVEVGGGVTHAVPIFEGFALPHATVRLEVAGQDITQALRKRLAEKGQNVTVDTARQIKERLCFVAPSGSGGKGPASSTASNNRHHDTGSADFELPDGTLIRLDALSRSAPTEILFTQPSSSLAGSGNNGVNKYQDGGVSNIVVKSIEMCDKDLQPDLLKNIVMAGASIMFPGLAERMKRDLVQLIPHYPGLKVTPDPANPEPGSNWQRKKASWIGGSIFTSLDTFSQVMVTNQEWEDIHEPIIHRKCI